MELTSGKIYRSVVDRKSDIGYVLKINDIEVFLHNKQALGDLEQGQVVDAFLYYDNQRRLTATLEKPLVTMDNPSWVDVVSVLSHVGVFVNIGINKDILISKDFLPYNEELWPQPNDRLFIQLKDKKNQLVGKVVSKNDLHFFTNHTLDLTIGDKLDAWVSRFVSEGVVAYTNDLVCIFIHETQMRGSLRLGQMIQPKITIQHNRHEYNGSLIETKETMIPADSEVIVNYLKAHQDSMYFGNDSDPAEIMLIFKMSKKAFKRALGHLYKERLIDFIDGKTVYKGK